MQSFLPNQDDLAGAGRGLMRLQDTYAISTDSIASGDLTKSKSLVMNADDCFQLGTIAYKDSDWYHALLWLSEALKLEEKETIKTVKRTDVLQKLSAVTFKQGNVQHAYDLTLEWLQIDPDNDRATQSKNEFSDLLMKQGKKKNRKNNIDRIENIRVKLNDHEDIYDKLCRGETTSPYNERHLTCQLRRHHPMFYINPLREEVLHSNPWVVVYHDIMSDEEIEKTKELAIPKLQRSSVHKAQESDSLFVKFRTSQSAWIDDFEHPSILRLSLRIMATTNLTLDTAEPYQVVNYGIGGQYDPHYDFRMPQHGQWDERIGNRIATVLCYLSNVEEGGRTVFNRLGFGTAAKKGSCLMWFNLLKNGEGDYYTVHAGCPVLFGDKWITNKWFHIRGQEFTRPCSLFKYE